MKGKKILYTVLGFGIFWLLRKFSIVLFAKSLEGMKEKAGNMGFLNPEFDKKMRDVAGFKNSQQWCAYFVRFAFLSKTKQKYHKELKYILSPSTQSMWQRAKNSKIEYISVHQKPKIGDIVIWQSQTNKNKGHTGIVTWIDRKGFISIEGNLNSYVELKKGNKIKQLKEGDNIKSQGIVARKYHYFNEKTLKGFIRFKQKINAKN